MWDSAALQEDCGAVDLIITPLWGVDCSQTPTISGAFLKWRGAVDVTILLDGQFSIRYARAHWNSGAWLAPGHHAPTASSIGQTVLPPAPASITNKIEAQQDRQDD